MSPLILDGARDSLSPMPQKRSHHFALSQAQYDDIPRLVDIEFFAFENEKTNHVLSYRDYNQPAHFQRAVRSYEGLMSKAENFRKQAKSTTSSRRANRGASSSQTRFRKVVDVETDVIVSWAKTEIKTYSEDELASPADSGSEGESEMNRDWFALNEKTRREYMGKKRHCYVGMVATQPSYQHQGAGTMLLEKILAEADDAGVECYLEATDTAKPLYERHGFVKVNELRFDPAPYGVYGYKIERQTVMVRGALNAQGVRSEVRSWPSEAVSVPL